MIKRIKIKKISFLFFLFLIPLYVIGQASYYTFHLNDLTKAKDLYEKGKYVAAQKIFDEIILNPNATRLEKSEAAYFSFMCSKELYNKDVKYKGILYNVTYPESPFCNEVNFQMGNYEYVNKNYKGAIGYYKNVDRSYLQEDDRAELHFKLGYCWLMQDSLELARIEFYQIKDIDNIYSSSALYYYSYIVFMQKNYVTALDGFFRLKDDEVFSSIVPYYIVQCYYYLGKDDDIISYAVPIIDSVIPSREAEIAYIIGNAYYRKRQFKEAIPFYERYFSKEKKPEHRNYYQPAYSYFQIGEYTKAIPLFEKIATENSLIGQMASYYLGYCYVKDNAKEKALTAFSTASQLSFDPNIQEDAMFNYAILTLELSNTPFNNSIKVLSDYINKYPNSRRRQEAYQYLISACINTKNYQEALNYLNKIPNKDAQTRKAYQRAAFYRALELYNNMDFENAVKLLEMSQRYNSSDAIIATRTQYWLAEIAFRNKEIEEALEGYMNFYNSPVATKNPEYPIVVYNIAYCYFLQKKYSTSIEWFQKFLKQKSDNASLITDAYNRLGDCYFANSKYKDAITYYTQAISRNSSDKDYAMFQKAFATGLLGDHKQKIEQLNDLLRNVPNSNYHDDALYEIGQSYLAIQNSTEAQKHYRRLISNYPLSSYVKKAWLQLGLIDYNNNQFDSAIVKYKKVITEYPNTSEARSALNGIKNIYIELGKADDFIKMSQTIGNINLGKAEQDSMMYYSAENLYTRKQWTRAMDGFKNYLNHFPNGNFSANAHFYLADCYLITNMPLEALEHLNMVIDFPRNMFTELALVKAIQMKIERKDYYAAIGNCEKLDSIAESYENQIIARRGKAICYFNLSRYNEAIESAQLLLTTPSIPQEDERIARYVMAKSYHALGDESRAIEQLRKIARDVKNKEGAEAKYLIAEILYYQNQYDKSLKEIFNFIDMNSPYQYWIAKAYILLARIYYQKNNTFQAVKTLESIIQNYDIKDDGIIQQAKDLKSSFEEKARN